MSQLQYYRETLGFDQAQHIPFTKRYRIRCSQCEALVINGVPAHEHGCPHDTKECGGCNARIPARQSFNYCEDCQ